MKNPRCIPILTSLSVLAIAIITGCSTSPANAQPAAAPAQGKKPNVVFILADNVGYGDLGCYGGGELRGAPTPRLDQLAREGLRLLKFLVEPACTPSRAALMTGQYSIRSGLSLIAIEGTPYTLPKRAVTMGELFKGAGYATAIFGKWHLGIAPESLPTAHGFDEFYGTLANTPFYHPTNFVDSRINDDVREVKDDAFYTTDAYAERALDWIDKNRDKPKFLYLPFNAQHAPFQATAKVSGALSQHPGREAAHVCRHDVRHGRRGRQGVDQGPGAGPGREHAHLLLFRQRRPDGADHVEQRSAARLQGADVGRRHANSLLRAVEG